MASQFAYPRIQFFRPNSLFWDCALGRRPTGAADAEALDIGQAGLREEFRARECDRPKGTPQHFFLVRFDGPLHVWLDDAWRQAPPGHTILWAPGRRHRYGVEAGKCVTHTYVFVCGRLVWSLMRSLGLPLNQLIAGVSAEAFETHVFTLVQEYLRPRPQPVVIENCVANLLHSVAADLSVAGPRQCHRGLQVVKRALELEFHRAHSLTSLARLAHCSAAHLSDIFKHQFGQAPIEYLIGLRLSHARHLLRSTDLPVKQIALQVGYEDPYFFSRLFKKHCGASPRTYRRAPQALPG